MVPRRCERRLLPLLGSDAGMHKVRERRGMGLQAMSELKLDALSKCDLVPREDRGLQRGEGGLALGTCHKR